MATLFVLRPDGTEVEVQSEGGESVMEMIRNAGVDELIAVCGGCCSCATCHVYLRSDDLTEKLPAMDDVEDALLDSSEHRKPESRLSCQLQFGPDLDGLRVEVAPQG